MTMPAPKQSVLTREMVVRGEITGEDALFIDGLVEGEINILGERVTVGPNGSVVSTSKAPCITAQEVVVLGTVWGNIVATDRVEIRANVSITGDVSTVRLKIEDGSFFQGGIDIRKAQPKAFVEADQEMSLSNLDYEPVTV
jgi:cytoskeletal protein CcmA (bactofilin family)